MLRKSALLIKNQPLLKLNYQYLTPIDKPVSSLALLSLQDCFTEIMYMPYVDLGFAAESSVFFGAFCSQLIISSLGSIIKVT